MDSLSLLPPEARALLHCAAGDRGRPALAALVRAPDFDWTLLTRLAVDEHVVAPVVGVLEGILGQERPEEFRRLSGLRGLQELSLFLMQKRLHEALAALRAAGHEVMLLKGAAMAYAAYGGIFMTRPMGDLDVLALDPSAIADVVRVLRGAGWYAQEGLEAERVYEEHHHLPPMLSPAPLQTVLELHRDVLPAGHPFGITVAMLRATAERVDTAGGAVLVPGPAQRLLLNCVHFAWSHYLYEGGAWRALRDVRASVEADAPPSWPELVRLARETRAATAMYWTLRLARSLLAVPVPEDALASLRPRGPAWLLDRLERAYVLRLFPTVRPPLGERLPRALWVLGMQPGRSGHGRARPWDADEEFVALALARRAGGPDGRPAARARLEQTAAALRETAAFARAVLFPGGGAGSARRSDAGRARERER